MRNQILAFFLCSSYALLAQDSGKIVYTTKSNNRYDCTMTKTESKKLKNIDQYSFIAITNSEGRTQNLYSDSIATFNYNGIFYRCFTTQFNKNKISFFAKEMTSGKAILYHYSGAKMDNEPVYIFKKMNETEFTFIKQNIEMEAKANLMMDNRITQDESGASSGSSTITKFYDEKPYLDYFRAYLSDCSIVYNKLKTGWYTFDSVEMMFKDYNKCL